MLADCSVVSDCPERGKEMLTDCSVIADCLKRGKRC